MISKNHLGWDARSSMETISFLSVMSERPPQASIISRSSSCWMNAGTFLRLLPPLLGAPTFFLHALDVAFTLLSTASGIWRHCSFSHDLRHLQTWLFRVSWGNSWETTFWMLILSTSLAAFFFSTTFWRSSHVKFRGVGSRSTSFASRFCLAISSTRSKTSSFCFNVINDLCFPNSLSKTPLSLVRECFLMTFPLFVLFDGQRLCFACHCCLRRFLGINKDSRKVPCKGAKKMTARRKENKSELLWSPWRDRQFRIKKVLTWHLGSICRWSFLPESPSYLMLSAETPCLHKFLIQYGRILQ